MSKRRTLKILSLLLAAALLTAACGRADEDGVRTGAQAALDEAHEKSAGQDEPLPDGTPAPEPPPSTEEPAAAWQGEGGCFTGKTLIYEKFLFKIYTWKEHIYTLYIDWNSEPAMRQLCQDDKVLYESPDIQDFALSRDGIWVFRKAAGKSAESRYSLLLLGYDGEELLKRDIAPRVKWETVGGMHTDEAGNLYILLSGGAAVYDKDANLLGEAALDHEGQSRLVRGNDGHMYIALTLLPDTNNETRTSVGRTEVFRLDAAGISEAPSWTLDGYYVSDGGDDYLLTLTDNTGLHGLNGRGEIVPIAIWEELGLSLDLPFRAQRLEGGRFLISSRGKTILLEPGDPSVIKVKTFLVMACFGSSPGSLISEFNELHPSYAVKIRDYADSGAATEEEALKQLNRDIMDGKAPDLFDFTTLPSGYLAGGGLAADLYPFMDNDPELNREDFILLDKLETGGSLYLFPRSCALATAAGLYSRFGSRLGWTTEEYLALQAEHKGDLMYNVTKESFLRSLARPYAAKAVDWKTGTCNFETKEFLSILESAALVRENPDSGKAEEDKGSPGRQLREGRLIAAAWYIDDVAKMAALETDAGERLSFLGRPSPDGIGGTELTVNSPVGICSRGNREGAWEFLRFVMLRSKETHTGFGIPVCRTLLDAEFAGAVDASGEGTVPMEKEYVQRFYDLLESSAYYSAACRKPLDIIMEEAVPFLLGRRTAEETARAVQEKVSSLMAECGPAGVEEFHR